MFTLNCQSRQIMCSYNQFSCRNTTLVLSDAVNDRISISEIVSKLLFNGTKYETYSNSKKLYYAIK